MIKETSQEQHVKSKLSVGESDFVMLQHYNKNTSLHRIDIKQVTRLGENEY